MSIIGTISAENGNLASILANSDLLNPTRNGSYSDDYQLVDVIISKLITINLESDDYDTYLQLINADTGEVIIENDDNDQGTNSRLSFVAAEGINYVIRVSGYDETELGNYQLSTKATLAELTDLPTRGDGYGGDGYGGDGYGGDGYGGDGYGGDGYGGDGYGGSGYGGNEEGEVDLVLTDIIAPTTAMVNDVISVSWTVENIGDASTNSYIADKIYLSEDNYLDEDDIQISEESGQTYGYFSLESGASYTISKEIILPNIDVGSKYLIFKTDSYENQSEANEINNIAVSPILLSEVDANLTITANAPTIAQVGESIDVSWMVNNTGSQSANANWYDRIYLSDDQYLDDDDDLAGNWAGNNIPVAEDNSYTVEENITLPSTRVGSQYLLFIADDDNKQSETDETDNIYATPIEIKAPDLAIVETDILEATNANTRTKISWTVKNTGDITTNAWQWYDRVYWSTDNIYDSSDEQINSLNVSGSSASIAPGDTYDRTGYFDTPDVKAGTYYVLFYTDQSNRQGETDEDNNITAVPIEITTKSPNLTVTNANAPSTIEVGNYTNVSWTVENSGNETAFAERWYDQIFLSTDDVYDSSDLSASFLYNTISQTPLAVGDSYTKNGQVKLPKTNAGNYYLLFQTDSYENQGETDETDNVQAVPIEVIDPPNLIVSNATAPAKVDVKYDVSVSWTITNTGEIPARNNWYDRVYLSADDVYDNSDERIASKSRGSIYSRTATPIEPGSSYTVDYDLDLPDVELGNYYLIFVADGSNGQIELDETDNTQILPIEIIDSSPDLNVTEAIAPGYAALNDTISANWTVTNNGTDSALAGYWEDKVYISDDEYFDESDLEVDSQPNNFETPLAAGDSYSIQRDIYIPNAQAGNKYLLFVADANKKQVETDETNNVKAVPISLNIPDVDLSLSVNSSPFSAIVQSEPTISWTVTNNGTQVTKAESWRDYIYLSDDEIYDESDRYVGYSTYSNNVPLEAGQSYTKSRTIDIPQTKTGERYLLFVSDFEDAQSDTNPANDTVAVPIEIKAPNLTISDIVTPIKANRNSTDINVSWKVNNDGNAITLASSWYDGVYFSTDSTYDSSDVKLTENQKVSYRRSNGRVEGRVSQGGYYSNSRNIDIPNADPGNYYLLFQTDTYKRQGEIDETDNVVAIPFEVLDTTNIAATAATAPLEGTLNDSIDVSWTVTNTGSATASATWSDFVFLSEDKIYDSSDVYVTRQEQEIDTFLAAGESYLATDSITIPKAAGIGDRYLLFVPDLRLDFAETDEADNVFALPIKLNAPNISVTNANSPSSVSFNETLDVSWTVTNTGDDRAVGSAAGSWTDYIYISDDAVYDDNDIYLNKLELTEQIPLESGESYLASQSIKIPRTVEAGNKYILFVTDKSNVQGETDETDNTLALPIEVRSPDLELDQDLVSVTADASVNQTLNISWTVNNIGDGTAYRDSYSSYQNWTDYIYISDDVVYDSSDRILTYQNISDPLESGQSYTFDANVRLSDERIGSQYILFVLDKNDVEKESDETNNVYAAPINIKTANLEVNEVSSPAEAVLNQQIAVSWTVTNTGEGDAFAPKNQRYSYTNPWRDLVYLSKDEIVDDNDLILSNYYHNHNKYDLASGESYTLSDNVYIPSTEAGEYYLLFATDVDKVLIESDDNDNVYSQPITVGATNLEITTVEAPTNLILNQTINASWTVTNTGNVTAPSEWYDYIYISDDQYWDNSDVYLEDQRTYDRSPLAGGDSYTFNKNLVIPHTSIGDRYLLFVTDRNNAQGETDETDNTYALPVNIAAPNLTVTNTNAPQSSYLGETIEVSWTVANQGIVSAPKSGYDHVYISDDQYLDDNDINLIAQTTGDYTSLGSEDEYTVSKDVTIPRTAIGDRYLLFVADRNNAQGETDETDNIVAVPFELTALDVDLVVSDIVAPLESLAGEEVEVVWTVTNNGSDDAMGTWTDRIYLASDTQNIKANEIYGSFDFTGTVAAGESIERRQKITLPRTLEGDFKIVVQADVTNSLIEYGKEDNNTTVKTEQLTSILPTFPNLQVGSVIAPDKAFSSQKTLVEWNVTNTGDGATSAPRWQDSVWLSLDQNFDGADIYLGQAANTSYLNPGESYNNSLEVTLPQGIDGNYHFLLQTDWNNKVFEFENEGDNLGVSNVSNIELTPPPDLQVSVNAPSNAFSSQFTSLSWTVTNEGQGRTLQSRWYDEVYLSTDTVLDSSDVSLGRQTHSGILEPGESYTFNGVNRLFKLPEGISGDYHFIVRTDAGGQVYESALSANNTGFDADPTTVFLTPPPDLEITVDAPDTALASHNLTIDYSVYNYGATATPYGNWSDTFYLSADDQLDASDIVLGSRVFRGSLDTGDYQDNSANFTLPNGISGSYYLFAKTDSNDNVFELDNENNTAFDTIIIDSQPADLAVSEVIASTTVKAGTGTQISWTVNNQGTGDTVKASWNDQLWLSLDSIVGNSDDLLLETFIHNGLLNAEESYTRDELVTIPFTLQGDYQLYVKTDANNSVYEADKEVNNNSTLSPLAIARETADLQVTTVNAPASGASEASITVEWSVANSGTGKTNTNYWYDEVFLSLDRDLGDSSDISLGKVYHSGSLELGETYDVSHSFKLPQELDGDYYVVVRTDTGYYSRYNSGDRVLESVESNNETAASSQTSISLNTVSDLVIDEIDAPSQAISGQTFNVNWTVSNQGANLSSGWSDVFYLSRDQVFDRSNDIYLGSSFNNTNLATGSESSKTAFFEIPRGLSGQFYLFGVTDSGNNVYERDGENNNIAFDGNSMSVILPPPVDLVAGAIALPTDGVPGQNITLNYTVTNEGDYKVNGNWEDAIYLSDDDQWDISDRLVEKVRVYDSVESGESYSRTVNANLPGVATGDYHVIVRSDIRNNVYESEESNNLAVSAEQINIDVPELEIGSSVSGTLLQEQEAYYRIDVPSGETLQFVLDSLSNDAVNELYISYGKMPTRADFDFGFEDVTSDQDIVVPLSKEGTYYILARGQYVPEVTQSYSLVVNTIDFGITDIETKVGDNGGTITFAIEGAKFNSNLTAALENEAGEIIESTNIWYEDSTKVFATFDLNNAAIDNYNLKVVQPSVEADFIENEAGEVVPVLRDITLESTLENGFEVIAAQSDDLLVTIDSTARVSPGQYFDVVLSYANNGTHDIEAPLLHLQANQNINFINIQDGDEFVGSNSMTLLGISNEGVAGTLRPGEIGTVRLRARAVNEGTINITASQVEDDGSSPDYEQFINYLGGDLVDSAWASAETALKEQFGTSWSSFASGLASLATERSASGVYSHSVSELWSDVALDAWGDGTIDNNVSQVESSSNIPSANLTLENTESLNFDDNLNAIPEPETLEDRLHPPDVQSHLRWAEQMILDGAAVVQNEYGADIAAAALEKFVGRSGLELPPSESYELLQDQLGESDLENPEIFNKLEEYIKSQIQGEWQREPSTVKYTAPSGLAQQGVSYYKYNIPYETTFHDNGSVISNAVKNSHGYQSKVKNNNSIEDYIETKIDENSYQGNNDLSSSPIYINNQNSKGIFGNSNDFNYFDQKSLGLATLKVIYNYSELVAIYDSSDSNPARENYQRYQNILDASIQNLQSLHNQYFGTSDSAELAFLMGRTPTETRQAKVNRINIEEADCHSPQLSYTAEIEFFILDGSTFGADDAYKDELVQGASLFQAGSTLGLLNFLINPFSGEDSLGRENINNLLKIGPALGLGWDVQQFGYGKPHFNLVKIEDTITGTISNPNYDSSCDEDIPHDPPTSPPLGQTNTGVFVSRDPNDILGPEGFGEEKWIDVKHPLDYTIRFENDPELASAPAQVVRITQQLDSDLDFRTFRVGDFGFGDTFVDVPDNRAFYQTRLNLVEEKGIYLDVFAGIDIAEGEAFWELRSIDPQTGEKPSDPLLGFLPPNLTKPEGDGFVTYTVRTDRNIETGAVIDAEATIVFDNNEPIDTPPIFNTIDAGKPTSTVEALPSISENEEFAISWSGNDDANGSAIADYTIYVAENDGDFAPWLENTVLTEATFTGTPGNTYEFYAVARDNAGNVQDIPAVAQAATVIAGGNNAPILLNPIEDLITVENSNFSLTIPDNVFQDLDAGDILTYTATLGDDSALPAWLSFNPETRILAGTPGNEDVGNLSIKITAIDNGNETVSNTFSLEIKNLGKNLTGDAGNNYLVGFLGNDTIKGGAGNDVIRGGVGADVLDGGLGLDILDYRYSDVGVTINLETGLASGGDAEGDSFTDFERIYGSSFGDNLTGDVGNNYLVGLLGDDTINGGEGNDVIRGGVGADVLDGGEGLDILDYRGSEAGVTVSLETGLASGGDAEGDSFTDFERIYGSSFGDNLAGDAGNNYLVGLLGDDTINGGEGNDVIRGGVGADVLDGGLGLDILDYRGSEAGVTVSLETGLASGGDAEGDSFINFERIYGSSFGDNLAGDAGNNYLVGLLGDDTINGGEGNDNIQGREGKDILTGGFGKDTFYLNQLNQSLFDDFDVITDLSIGEDAINAPVAINAANIIDFGTISDLTEINITNVLSSLGAGNGATFGFDSRTFLAINDETAGFSVTNDALIEITGYQGDLNELKIV